MLLATTSAHLEHTYRKKHSLGLAMSNAWGGHNICFLISTFSYNRHMSRDLLNRTWSRFCQALIVFNAVALPQVYWPHNFTRPPWTLSSLDAHLDISGLMSQKLTLTLPLSADRIKVDLFADGSTAHGSSSSARTIPSIGEESALRLSTRTASTAAGRHVIFEAVRDVQTTPC